MKEIIKKNQSGIVLFLGRVTNFTPQEIGNFLEEQGMVYADKYEGQEIALLVLSTMMTPMEEQLSYDLYDEKIPDVSLARFEEYYTTHIKPNTLLMSLKLSNDQERIKRLLENEAFLDEVYLKLFKLYDWGVDGIHENDNNRDVTVSFVKRFFRPDGFRDPAMIYAPTTVTNIAQDTEDGEVLEAILSMPNHKIKVSRKEHYRPKNLRELVAFNEAISLAQIRYLLGFNDKRINYFLASNGSLHHQEQKQIFLKADSNIKLMFTHNEKLDDMIYEKLLRESDEIIASLFSYQPLDTNRFQMILAQKIEPELMAYLGESQKIRGLIPKLFELNNRALDFRLASNPTLSHEDIEWLYHKYNDEIAIELSQNTNLTSVYIEKFYHQGEQKIIENLALNHSTPTELLDELCLQNDRELNRLLASNPSVSLHHLQQFQLDPSLMMILAKNRTYGESVLKGLGI